MSDITVAVTAQPAIDVEVTNAGATGPEGPVGPSAVSADDGNIAILGSDDLIFVPESGGGGAVDSVAGRTGDVVLTADDMTDGTTNHVFTVADDTKLAGIATAATANDTDANLKARANHTGTQSADTLTDGTTNKAFLATERTKLAGIATAATANDTDANLKARANHTGTQTASTISDFNSAADARVAAGIIVAGTANNPHTTQGATRNSALPKNFWQYTGTEGVDDPTNAIAGDEWISA
jgi:hypothetical protein